MKKNFKLQRKDKDLSNFMKNHGLRNTDELTFDEFKKLILTVISAFLEKEIDSEEFQDLAYRLWSSGQYTDDRETAELETISYVLSELSYGMDDCLEEHHPEITEKNKDKEIVYEYNSAMNQILRYYIDHKDDVLNLPE